MKDYKNFYRVVLGLVIPIALQNLINVGVNAADVLMLGKVSEEVLSGASLGGQVQFIMTLIFFGLTSGASVLVAQYWGKKDIVTIEKVLGISIRISLVISFLFMIAAYSLPVPIMRLLSNNEQVIQEGAQYLRIVCFSYVFCGITMVYLNILRSVENVAISTLIYTVSLFINIIGNAVFIFGLGDFPALGIRGAALSTLIARFVELLIVIYYDRKKNKIFRFHVKMLFQRDKLLSADFIKFSMPVVINELLWGSGVAVIAAIVGHMGSAASAANSIVQMVRQLSQVLSFGVASATAIIIGKAIGEGAIDRAKEYGKRLVFLSVCTGLIACVVVLVTRTIVLSTMNLSPEAMGYLSAMMLILAYFVIGQSLNTTMVVGVFRAGGDTKYGLFIDVTFMWIVSIGLGSLGAFAFGWAVPLVYMVLLSDEIIKIPFTIQRYLTFKWLKNITRN